ncbi:DoxX family membrane protein [Actinoplanes sp. CA-142083]|uniref:DoxX family membrane protein n=1 Tax=Actinoplanes sp. CA-142083 TaxID=3239903 RepID=UPI003D9144B5
MTTIGRDSATHLERAGEPGSVITASAARALALLRVALGFIFLWSFLDKALGLGYSTPEARAWINGGSPTKGFLASVDVGPLQDFFHDIAGKPWADWLFMLGLLGLGLALILGIGLRVAAVAMVAMMALMWLAEWPLAKTTDAGDLTGSSNPVDDYHVIYALSAIVIALTYAGRTWGLGRWWAALPLVRKNRWLI